MQFKGLDDADMKQPFNYFSNPKYKNQIMEKYLRGLDETQENKSKCGLELSKWLESAANFTPDKNNYIEWESNRCAHYELNKWLCIVLIDCKNN